MTPLPPQSGLEARLAFASDLARRAGRRAAAFRAGTQDLGVEVKGVHDFVTRADRTSEALMRSELARAFPADGFVGEESGGTPATGGFWVVDPIDGTTNYLRGLGGWAVCLAYVAAGGVELGIVYDAPADRLYSAMRGHGAFCEGAPIAASGITDPSRAMALLGHSARTGFAAYGALCAKLHSAGCEYRRLGAAAVGLVRVAEGAAEIFFEAHLFAWDVLAGTLIAAEAGAEIAMPDLSAMLEAGGPVLAAVPTLAQTLDLRPQACVPAIRAR